MTTPTWLTVTGKEKEKKTLCEPEVIGLEVPFLSWHQSPEGLTHIDLCIYSTSTYFRPLPRKVTKTLIHLLAFFKKTIFPDPGFVLRYEQI